MGWFGPSKDEVWQQLASEIGGQFVEGGLWRGDKVQARSGPWTITLDTQTHHYNNHVRTDTRLRAPYVNSDGFRFTLHRKGLFTGLAKLLGAQDIEIGDPQFDDDFVIKANDEQKIRDLLASPRLRQLIAEQPTIFLEVRDSEGWFGPSFPDDVDELLFQVPGVIKDIPRLKALFDLFAEVLDRLTQLGSALKQEPNVEL